MSAHECVQGNEGALKRRDALDLSKPSSPNVSSMHLYVKGVVSSPQTILTVHYITTLTTPTYLRNKSSFHLQTQGHMQALCVP